jgi:hypothetical protein
LDDRLQKLLDLAFRIEPAAGANVAIDDVRHSEAQGGQPVRSYELVLAPDATFVAFAEKVLPRLVYHLESLKARPPAFNGTVVSIFVGERLLFVRAADFLPAAAGLLATTVDELYRRHGTGELRTAVPAPRGPPLALPPKTK